jgi:hypothetical protein
MDCDDDYDVNCDYHPRYMNCNNCTMPSIQSNNNNNNNNNNNDEPDRLKELYSLYQEADIIFCVDDMPDEDWYSDRYKKIMNYNEINWSHMVTQYNNKDSVMYYGALKIMTLLETLRDEYYGKPEFDLVNYKELLETIIKVWEHFSKNYMDDNNDGDITDLIEGIAFMNK